MTRRPERPTPLAEPSAPRNPTSARALSTLRALLVASTVAGLAIWGGAVWAQSPEDPVEEVGPPPTIRVPPPPPPPPDRSEPEPRPPREPAGRRKKRRRCPDAKELRAGEYGRALASYLLAARRPDRRGQ